jgi:outer membrane protein assembly factor BamB
VFEDLVAAPEAEIGLSGAGRAGMEYRRRRAAAELARRRPALLWKTDGLGTGWSAPIIVGERLYITGDVGDDLVIFALDLNGKVQWRAKNGRAWKTPYPGARAAAPGRRAACTI